MLSLLDGPCKGTFMVKRAPIFLRAVAKPVLLPREPDDEEGQIRTDLGEADVLDQLEDTPADGEQVFIYERMGNSGWIHLQARGQDGKKISGYYATGQYKYRPDVDGERFRDNNRWREWVSERVSFREPGTTVGPDGSIQNGGTR